MPLEGGVIASNSKILETDFTSDFLKVQTTLGPILRRLNTIPSIETSFVAAISGSPSRSLIVWAAGQDFRKTHLRPGTETAYSSSPTVANVSDSLIEKIRATRFSSVFLKAHMVLLLEL